MTIDEMAFLGKVVVEEAAHAKYPLAPDFRREHRPEPVPPEPHCLVANVNPTFEQQVLNVAQAERKPDIHQHHQADHLG